MLGYQRDARRRIPRSLAWPLWRLRARRLRSQTGIAAVPEGSLLSQNSRRPPFLRAQSMLSNGFDAQRRFRIRVLIEGTSVDARWQKPATPILRRKRVRGRRSWPRTSGFVRLQRLVMRRAAGKLEILVPWTTWKKPVCVRFAVLRSRPRRDRTRLQSRLRRRQPPDCRSGSRESRRPSAVGTAAEDIASPGIGRA